jgi:hypothetical protein
MPDLNPMPFAACVELAAGRQPKPVRAEKALASGERCVGN